MQRPNSTMTAVKNNFMELFRLCLVYAIYKSTQLKRIDIELQFCVMLHRCFVIFPLKQILCVYAVCIHLDTHFFSSYSLFIQQPILYSSCVVVVAFVLSLDAIDKSAKLLHTETEKKTTENHINLQFLCSTKFH